MRKISKDTVEIIKDYLFDCLKEAETNDLPSANKLNDFIFIKKSKFDSLVFLNPKTEEMLELSNEYGNVSSYKSSFNAIVIEKVNENLFHCLNCWDNDLEVLKYKMKQHGITSFTIEENKEATKEKEKNRRDSIADGHMHNWDDDFRNDDIYDLKFRSKADCAAFQLYFQKYLRDKNDNK